MQRYELALSELKFAEESLRVDNRLLSFSEKAAKTQFDSRLEVIRAEARALLAEYQRYAAYSNAQAALGPRVQLGGSGCVARHHCKPRRQVARQAMETTTNSWQMQVFKVGATRPGAGAN